MYMLNAEIHSISVSNHFLLQGAKFSSDVLLGCCSWRIWISVLFSIRSWRSTYPLFQTLSFLFNGIPAPTGKSAVWMGRATVLGLSMVGMWCCELCVESCTRNIMSALAGVGDPPSLLPGSVEAALACDATCACSAAPKCNAVLAALMDVDRWGWLWEGGFCNATFIASAIQRCCSSIIAVVRCIIPALMASTKLCCSRGPTGAKASGTIPTGVGLDEDSVPVSSSPTTKSVKVRGDARARAPRSACDVETAGALLGVLLSLGWGLVFFWLGTFGMLWNKYTCYNLVDKR